MELLLMLNIFNSKIKALLFYIYLLKSSFSRTLSHIFAVIHLKGTKNNKLFFFITKKKVYYIVDKI